MLLLELLQFVIMTYDMYFTFFHPTSLILYCMSAKTLTKGVKSEI